MVGTNAMGEWIPLMDYAGRTGISLSTLRRYIKSNRIPHRTEDGRYLLLFQENPDGDGKAGEPSSRQRTVAPLTDGTRKRAPVTGPATEVSNSGEMQSKIRKLALELRKAHEEIAELKTLIAFYEESLGAGNAGGPGAPRPGSSPPLGL